MRAHVRVPATSANLGPGFDALALALAWYDDVTAVRSGSGLQIEVSGVGAADVPRDERHLVVRAMDATFAELGEERGGLVLRCANTIPHGQGLGSSAAAIVAGVLLARALVHDGAHRLDDAAVLAVAARLEGHPDNAAAALLGGFTIAWPEACRRPRSSPRTRSVAACRRPRCPTATLATETARGLLPPTVPHVDAVHAAARSALLVARDHRRARPVARRHRGPAAPGLPRARDAARPSPWSPGSGLRDWPRSSPEPGPASWCSAAPELTGGAVAADRRPTSMTGWTVRAVDLDRRGAQRRLDR